ncbi:MAG: multiple resistance and pH regulation protein F [Gammaproteobacteria bacterium]|nr:multiple resistance and pH regulation protein F [Gammaproteobacteria bacterium]
MKSGKWIIGSIILVGLLLAIVNGTFPFLFFPDLPYESFVGRAMFVLILAAGMCLFRISRGPTAADRIVAVDIFGILIVGFCAILSISTGRSWYIDIGIAWALQSFIGSLALGKYLEGKRLEQ